MTKRILSAVMCGAVICGLILSMSGCGAKRSQPGPGSIVYRLENAINHYDVESVVRCYEPAAQRQFAYELKPKDAFIDNKDMEEAVETCVPLAEGFGNVYQIMKSVQVSLMLDEENYTSDSEATIKLTVNFRGDAFGENAPPSGTAVLDLIKIDGYWYIQVPDSSRAGEDVGETEPEQITDTDPEPSRPVSSYSTSSRVFSSLGGGYGYDSDEDSDVYYDDSDDYDDSDEGSTDSDYNVTIPANADFYQELVLRVPQLDSVTTVNQPATSEIVNSAVSRVKYENPSLFWAQGGKFMLGTDYTSMYWKFDDSEIKTMHDAYEKKISEIVKSVPSSLSDWDKAIFVHDYFVRTCTYDTTLNKPMIHTSYGAVINGNPVCDGYSGAFMDVMQRLGFDCGVCHGDCHGSSSERHAWNFLTIDGVTGWVDVTWDDLDDENADLIRHNYFMIDDSVLKNSRGILNDTTRIPTCSSMSQSYAVKKGLYFESYDFSKISSAISKEWPENHQVELSFANKTAYDQAMENLIDKGDIWSISAVSDSISTYRYIPDDETYSVFIYEKK